MRKILFASLALLMAGCAKNEEQIWDLEAQLDVKNVEIQELRDKVERQKAQHKRTINILQDSIERTETELRHVREMLTAQIEERDATIEALNEQITELTQAEEVPADEAAPAEAVEQPEEEPAVRISTYETPESPPIPPPPPPAEDLMPVRVYDIEGRKIETGSHKTRRYVETDETYRDQFGNKKKRGEWVEHTVMEYGYKVSFSIENLSNKEMTITARAGLVDKAILLRPGDTVENIEMDAANGSSLILQSGGHRKRFAVSY